MISEIKLVEVKEIAYDMIVIIYWHLRLEKKKAVKKSERIRKRKEGKSLVGFEVVITRRKSVQIKETGSMRKIVIVVILNYQTLV